MNSFTKQHTQCVYHCFFTLLFLVFGCVCYGQQKVDSLTYLSLQTLEAHIKANENMPEAYQRYTQTFLEKAKTKNDSLLIGKGYYYSYDTTTDFTERLHYLDSAIFYVQPLKSEPFLVQLYLAKGTLLFDNNEYAQALENYLLAKKNVQHKRNAFYYDIKYNIGFLQRTIGEYKSAEETFLACLEFEDIQNIRYDILFQLSCIYYETGQYDKATAINRKVIKTTIKKKQFPNYYLFVAIEGINLSLKKVHHAAIDSIQKALPHLHKGDRLVAQFYLGKSYHALGETEKALNLFKVIDTAFSQKADIMLPMRESYEFLIKDAKQKKNAELQLYYMDQLLTLDSIHHKQYKDVSLKIEKEYNTPRILSEKVTLIEKLTKNSEKTNQKLRWSIGIGVLLGIVALIILAYHFRLKKQYQKRFQNIIKRTEENQSHKKDTSSVHKKSIENAVGLDAAVIEKILARLQLFEDEKQYLQNQISLHDVAKITQTNTKYLSKIINSYKNKTFTNYINDLRVEYTIDRIQNDEMYKKYTIKAIAQEAGFTNSGAYFRAFFKKTGLKPSYFIQKVHEAREK